MNGKAKGMTSLLFLFLTILSASAQAEQKSLEAIITWDGEGRVFQIADQTMQFLGSFEGIIYVKTHEGKLNEGFVSCPANQTLNLKTGKTKGSGHCMITASPNDTVYAKWSCNGVVGKCEGDFKLTGGTGKFKGVKGSSKMLIRSPLRALIADMPNNSVLRVGSGIAILPELKYTLAKK